MQQQKYSINIRVQTNPLDNNLKSGTFLPHDAMTKKISPVATVESDLAHHHYGPSSLKHYECCPCYSPTPDNGNPHPVTVEGSMLHKRWETGDRTGLTGEQNRCIDAIDNLCTTLFRELESYGEVKVEREVRLSICNGLTFGTFDYLAISGKKSVLVDAKFGYNPVDDAEINIQGWAYAIGVFEKYPEVDEVQVHFAQPRLNAHSFGIFDRATHFKKMQARVATVIARAESPLKKPTPTNLETCTYCSKIGDCEVHHSNALIISKGYDSLHENELPDLFHPSQLATPAKRAQAQVLASVMEKWCESVKKSNTEFVLMGGDVPGFKMVEKKGARKVTNSAVAYKVAREFGLSPEEFAETVTVSPVKLENKIAELAPTGSKEKTKQQVEDFLLDRNALEFGQTAIYLARDKANKNKLTTK